MNKLICLAGILLTVQSSSYAACKHIEYPELKEMDTLSLSLEYMTTLCTANKTQKSHEIDVQLQALESKQWGAGSLQAALAQKKADQSFEEEASCRTESDRMLRVLEKRKIDKSTRTLMNTCK